MKIRAFITHKKAEYFKDCQDRFSINADTKSVAVSDGMSQSYQQKIWAEMLVNSYTESSDWEPNLTFIKDLAPQWENSVRQFIKELKENNAPQYLIIMNENALASRKSAGATFCGIRFDENKWRGHVLGDSCLIEIVNNKIQHMYTSQQGEEFDNHPDYFDSNPLSNGKGTPLAISGKIEKSTKIVIVSDPFSDFLNEKMKLGNEDVYIKKLLSVSNHEDFEALVADWRDNFGMHNDDSTLVIIEDDGTNNFNIDPVTDILDSIIDEEAEREKQEEEAKAQKQFAQEQVNAESSIVETKVESHHSSILASTIGKEEFIEKGVAFYCEEKMKFNTFELLKERLQNHEPAIRLVLEEIYKQFYIIDK